MVIRVLGTNLESTHGRIDREKLSLSFSAGGLKDHAKNRRSDTRSHQPRLGTVLMQNIAPSVN